jgi:tripartite-type tricarboxylate transporter receptor subunit TctC
MKRTAFVIALLLSTCGSSRSIAENHVEMVTECDWFVVPFQAGGPIDTIARIVAQQLSEKWGAAFCRRKSDGSWRQYWHGVGREGASGRV